MRKTKGWSGEDEESHGYKSYMGTCVLDEKDKKKRWDKASDIYTRHTVERPLYTPDTPDESGKKQLLNVLGQLPQIQKKEVKVLIL